MLHELLSVDLESSRYLNDVKGAVFPAEVTGMCREGPKVPMNFCFVFVVCFCLFVLFCFRLVESCVARAHWQQRE